LQGATGVFGKYQEEEGKQQVQEAGRCDISLGDAHQCHLYLVDTKSVSYTPVFVRTVLAAGYRKYICGSLSKQGFLSVM
jgi:hypothetical protein